jgi:outer membrane receptor for ferrienterochelin and colicins
MLLFPVITYASQRDANINGHVIDAKTGEHLPYVTIALKGTTVGITTDATGHYFLKDLPVGQFTLIASYLGYKTAEKQVNIESLKTLEVNFELEEENFSLSEVVVSATRNETKKQETGIIVNVLSGKLFEAVSSNNLSETMCFQPGLRVENNCGNCGTTQLRINGLEGQYSQVLVDSRPIFSSLAAVYGLEQLPVAMIERVEVVRGGGSALFGSNAIGGVVNIITKEPLRNSLTLSNTTNLLGDGTPDVNTSVNGSFVSDDHKAGAYVFGMLKDRSPYDHNRDGFSDIPKINSSTLGFKGYYRTGLYSKLTAEYHHINEMRRGGNNFDNPPHEAHIAEYLNHNIHGGGLKFDFFTPDYQHRASIYSSAQGILRDSYFAAQQHTDNYGKTTDATFVTGAQYTFSSEHLLFMPAELTGGMEYSYNRLKDKIISIERNLHQTSAIKGGFFQSEWKNQRIGLLIGARLDKHNLVNKAVFSPRGTFRYNPSDRLHLRASYSSGYRAPQAYNEDLHIEAVGGTLGLIELSPNLKPEYSHSLSASADGYFNLGPLQCNLLTEVFHTVLNNVFTLEKTGEDSQGNRIYTRRNASGATVKGVNAEARFALSGKFDLQLGYTCQQSRYKQPEQWSEQLTPQKRTFRAPDNYGYFITNLLLSHDWNVSLFGSYTGPMLVKHTQNEKDTEKITPNFFDMGIKLSCHFHLSKAVELEWNGGFKNIFNSFQRDMDYGQSKDASYIYGPAFPRMFFMGLKFTM